MIIQRFNLNLIPNQSPVIVHVNQYDTGAGRLIATLYEGNEPYSPNGTAVIQGTKPDGHGFQYTATLEGNVVTADLTEQMSPVAGDVRAQIVVTESSGVTGTFVFIMRVQPSALPNDTDMSESDYQYIEEAIREAQEAVETAQEATETAQEAVERAEAAISETQENAEDSEAWAQGTRGGIPVESTDPTYEHNAEYWAQYAERYAQGGLHYKGSIPFADIPTTGMREGDMYNITDDFTTDSRFEEGAGIEVKGGTNIAWNSDNKWDVLALPPKTTFNGRSGSILPMAGDYDSKKILLSSALHIGGETQNDVQQALEALSDDGVKSFNGRSGSVLPMAGDYDSEKILLASVLHIGGETQNDVQEALEALEGNKADKVDNAVEDNFAGLDADGNLKDSGKNASDFATPSDIAGQQNLLKDTVGFTGKNWLKNIATSRTIYSVTYTVNPDKSVTVNGTGTNQNAGVNELNQHFTLPAGNYILSGSPHNVYSETGFKLQIYNWTDSIEVVTCNTDEDAHFAIGENKDIAVRIWFRGTPSTSGEDVTFYPMIRKADITDPTYEPYHESVEVMYEEEIHGVNLLENEATSQTINGVTFTVNADGSVTVNGTATADATLIVYDGQKKTDAPFKNIPVILSKGNGALVANTSLYCNTYQGTTFVRTIANCQGILNAESDVFEVDYNGYDGIRVGIKISNGVTLSNAVFRPMIRKADIEDSTYRPYNYQAIQNQLNAQGVLGAKNLLKNNATSQTINGVTFTVNSDGSVVLNGTATNTGTFIIAPNSSDAEFSKHNCILTGCPAGGSTSTYNLCCAIRTLSDSGVAWFNDFGSGVKTRPITSSEMVRVYITYYSGQTYTNLTFYPMLRLASDPDDTYQPYAMTNRELTEEVSNIKSANAVGTITANSNLNDYYKTGDYYSNTGSNTATLTNKPSDLTGAFRLSVICAGYPIGEGSNASNVPITQKIELVNGATPAIYMRHKLGGSDTYGSWYKFTGAVVS